MPKKGWKSITVSEECAVTLEAEAEKHGRSIPEHIEHLIGSNVLEVGEEKREEYRSTLLQIALELKASSPAVHWQKIREWLKELVDVTV